MGNGLRTYSLLRSGGVVAGLFVTAFLLVAGALVNFAVRGPGRWLLLGIAVLLLGLVVGLAIGVLRDRIDSRLEREVGRRVVGLAVAVEDFPEYRFVDVFRAVESIVGDHSIVLDSAHPEDLGSILNGTFFSAYGFSSEPARTARSVDPAREEFFPADRFWIRRVPRADIVRFRKLEHMNSARLEVASADAADAESTIAAIRELSVTRSIYRGRSVEVSFVQGVSDSVGNVEQSGRFKVDFRRTPAITEKDIVLDPSVWPLIQHSLIDLQRNRADLMAANVTVKRGFLFYGPPGTGKSLTCRYIATLLPDTTIVCSTGAALHQVASTFNLARMLQPSVVVLEDVDLVFASRDINAFGAALGDLFDQMDKLADYQPICVILTTNAIDRVEAAIRDRPGRVSQCLYFGPPSAELRRRFLLSCLGNHATNRVDLDKVVSETDGATQAFLRELVSRALQFSVEAKRDTTSPATPTTSDFDAALAEIRAFDGRATRVITGFRV